MVNYLATLFRGGVRNFSSLSAVDNFLYLLAGMTVFIFCLVCGSGEENQTLALVSLGAFTAGGLIAFLNTRMRDEEPLLGKYALALNAALTTSFLTDALNKDGHLRSFVAAASRSAYKNESGQPRVAAAMLAMAILGFLAVYLYRVSRLNRELQQDYRKWGAREVFDTTAGSITSLADRELTRLVSDTAPVVSEALRKKAVELLAEMGSPDMLVSVDDVVLHAKCCCMSGDPVKGLALIEERLATNPDNAALSLNAGMILLIFDGEKERVERYRKAGKHLASHCSSKAARLIALRALGYCHIMRAIHGACPDEERTALLVEAKKITSSYIGLWAQCGEVQPADKGALVNLASVMALLKEPEDAVLSVLREAMEAGAGKELLSRLSETDGDDRLTELESLRPKIMAMYREMAGVPAPLSPAAPDIPPAASA